MSSKRGSRGGNAHTRSAKARPQSPRPDVGASATPVELQLAGVGRRIFGYVIDVVLLTILGFAIGRLANRLFGTGSSTVVVVIVVHAAVVVSYGAVLIGWRGATIGMGAANIRALDSVSGRTLEGRRTWARSAVAFALTGLALGAVDAWGFKTTDSGIDGALAAGALLVTVAGYATYYYFARWDALHQTLQDKVGHSIVVFEGTQRARDRPKWSWRAAASGLSRGYTSGYRTPVGRKGR
jgi:hypothetical protein